jgi:hypothetical protein
MASRSKSTKKIEMLEMSCAYAEISLKELLTNFESQDLAL